MRGGREVGRIAPCSTKEKRWKSESFSGRGERKAEKGLKQISLLDKEKNAGGRSETGSGVIGKSCPKKGANGDVAVCPCAEKLSRGLRGKPGKYGGNWGVRTRWAGICSLEEG